VVTISSATGHVFSPSLAHSLSFGRASDLDMVGDVLTKLSWAFDPSLSALSRQLSSQQLYLCECRWTACYACRKVNKRESEITSQRGGADGDHQTSAALVMMACHGDTVLTPIVTLSNTACDLAMRELAWKRKKLGGNIDGGLK